MKNLILSALLLLCATTATDAGKLPPRSEIIKTMKAVADWQIHDYDLGHHAPDPDWTNGALFVGLCRWAQLADSLNGDPTYYKWLYKIGSRNGWQPDKAMYHADAFCVCQTYIDLYRKYRRPALLWPTIARTEFVMNHPSKGSFAYTHGKASTMERWTWCDALFMAPPVYAKLYRLTGEKRFMEFADKEFRATTSHLFDTEEDLFYRDHNYMPPKLEANGRKIFWGRGNGWVAAGLANILRELPAGDAFRPFYEDLFKRMARKLMSLQGADGYWHASLLDPASYPSPETSSTGLITYALAYGVNAGLISRKEAMPSIVKGWEALLRATDANGRLGFVQPVGETPKSVTREMTAVYGPGAMLAAGCEIYRLAK
jgi:unsaturated rhamnogalacturonyl hydrolase